MHKFVNKIVALHNFPSLWAARQKTASDRPDRREFTSYMNIRDENLVIVDFILYNSCGLVAVDVPAASIFSRFSLCAPLSFESSRWVRWPKQRKYVLKIILLPLCS